MSEENVEIIHRVIDAWNRRDEIEDVNHPEGSRTGTRRGITEVSAVWRSQWESS